MKRDMYVRNLKNLSRQIDRMLSEQDSPSWQDKLSSAGRDIMKKGEELARDAFQSLKRAPSKISVFFETLKKGQSLFKYRSEMHASFATMAATSNNLYDYNNRLKQLNRLHNRITLFSRREDELGRTPLKNARQHLLILSTALILISFILLMIASYVTYDDIKSVTFDLKNLDYKSLLRFFKSILFGGLAALPGIIGLVLLVSIGDLKEDLTYDDEATKVKIPFWDIQRVALALYHFFLSVVYNTIEIIKGEK